MIIRIANELDASRLLEIYRVYVEETAITFEYTVPSIEVFRERIKHVLKNYPYLVCEVDNKIVGFAYASPHKEREAYKWCVDTSIYVDSNYHGRGIAKILYDNLISLLKEQGIFKLMAIVTMPNAKSENFHKKFGFEPVAIFEDIGYKLGEWRSVQYFELIINNKEDIPLNLKRFSDIIDMKTYKKRVN